MACRPLNQVRSLGWRRYWHDNGMRHVLRSERGFLMGHLCSAITAFLFPIWRYIHDTLIFFNFFFLYFWTC